MNAGEPMSLPLRDIHLPEPVPWWPPAPGWWITAGLVALIAVCALALWWWRQRLRTRRAALSEIAAIEQAFAVDGDGHACARRLSRLLRQVALLRAAPASAAATGDDWLDVVRELDGDALPPQLRPVFLLAPYSAAAARAIEPAHYQAASAFLRKWIGRLRSQPARRRARS